ncbi:rRNA small subunit methyltransferase I [hydrothermal vent metagenome]|uniref:rRNA small subunit methyltransferase I n=1 Tax=hydrothermal vent metagenome TaxID=652676 RepID=A0A3B1DXG1_9ZZZZ
MLTLVPTPIGNIGDITLRSLDVLQEAELILSEDTRVIKKLLNLISLKFNIHFKTHSFISLHSHNEKNFLTNQNKEILLSKNVVYVSDAGMPCISDPGACLVNFCINNNIKYDVLPGANALLTAFAMSGFDNKEFTFFGFLPHQGRQRKVCLHNICTNPLISILYESPHRLLKLLKEIKSIDESKEVFVAKEITKLYQQIFKGTIQKVYDQIKVSIIKGEWVVILNNSEVQTNNPIILEDIQDLKLPPKQKAKLISKLTGKNIKDVYNSLL